MVIYDYEGQQVPRTLRGIGNALNDPDSWVSAGSMKLKMVVSMKDDDFDYDNIEFQIFKDGEFVYAFRNEERAVKYFLENTDG